MMIMMMIIIIIIIIINSIFVINRANGGIIESVRGEMRALRCA